MRELPAWLADPALATGERYRVYDTTTKLADLDAVSELVLGEPLLDVNARTAGYVRIVPGGRPPDGGFRPLALVGDPDVRRVLSKRALSVYATLDRSAHLGGIDTMFDARHFWLYENAQAARALMVAAPNVAPEDIQLWLRLGRLPPSVGPARPVEVAVSVVNLSPEGRLVMTLGEGRMVTVRSPLSETRAYMTQTQVTERSALVAASTTFTVSLPAGFIEQPGGPIDAGYQEFVTRDGTGNTAVQFVYVSDLVIRQ